MENISAGTITQYTKQRVMISMSTMDYADTYRSLHPLQLLLNARQQQDMVRSYLRMYEQSGWLPSFPSAAGDQAVMIGHHAAEFILDVYAKGYRVIST